MTKCYLYLLLLSCLSTQAQEIQKAQFILTNDYTQIQTLLLIDSILFSIDEQGQITSSYSINPENAADYFEENHQENMAKLKQYGRFGFEEKPKKTKQIGHLEITYYGQFDSDFRAGKLKSIGSIPFEYYNPYGLDEEIIGRLKSIGNHKITYYSRFSAHFRSHKVERIGPVQLEYRIASNEDGLVGKLDNITGNTRDFYVKQQQQSTFRTRNGFN